MESQRTRSRMSIALEFLAHISTATLNVAVSFSNRLCAKLCVRWKIFFEDLPFIGYHFISEEIETHFEEFTLGCMNFILPI
jgi:hypothetical protein